MFLPKTHECKVLTFLKLVVSKAFFFPSSMDKINNYICLAYFLGYKMSWN